MEVITNSNMRKQASFFTFATMVALFSHSLVIPVMSTTEYYSPKPTTTITPPAGDTPTNINCNNPPHGGGGGSDGHHDPSTPSKSPPSGHHDGGGSGGYHYSPPPYTPTTPTPTIPTPKTPIVTPPTDPHTPTPSTPTPTTPTYTPRTPIVAPPTVPHTPTFPIPTTPPSVRTPPFPFPNTPPFGTTPPFSYDPSSSGPFPCTFWRMHPTMIWGLMGWNGNTVSSTFGVGNVGGFGAGMNLLEALSNTRTDGFGELYREGTAALLNSMASKSFPYSAQQVKLSFGRAALSSNGDAAAAQAKLFKMANEGHFKAASP